MKFEVTNRSTASNKITEITIYDEISFWGVNERNFKLALNQAKGTDLVVRINSPGGSVSSGIEIHDMLKRHEGKTTAVIASWCASIATIIALGCQKVVMGSSALFMVHQASVPWTGGNSGELRKTADVLDKVDENLVNIYEAKTKKPRTVIEQWMSCTTFFTAKEALNAGLIDEIDNSVSVPAQAVAFSDITRFFPGATLPQNHTTPNPSNTMDLTQALAALKDKEAALTAKAGEFDTLNASKTAEDNRIKAIMALHDKYADKLGNMSELALKAITAKTSADEFTNMILEASFKAPKAAAPGAPPASGIRPPVNAGDPPGGETPKSKTEQIEALQKRIQEATDMDVKNALLTELKNLRRGTTTPAK